MSNVFEVDGISYDPDGMSRARPPLEGSRSGTYPFVDESLAEKRSGALTSAELSQILTEGLYDAGLGGVGRW